MRESTAKKIDALHAEIERLTAAELAHHDKQHPQQDDFLRHIAHVRIEWHIKSRGTRRALGDKT